MGLGTTNGDHLTELAIKMKHGNRAAASELYDDLMPKLFGFLFSRTSNREVAEDLSQDTFLKLVEKIGTYDESRGRFTVWFWQMSRNALIDYYRGKKEIPFSSFEDDTVEAMASVELPNLDHKLRREKLKELIKILSEEERELFELRYVAEMSYKEIAETLGRSEGSLRIASLRVKEKLKKSFHEH